MSQISSTSLIMQVQTSVCDLLNQHHELSSLHVIPENSKDIEYEITRALKVQGVVGVVMTPTLKFVGTDSGTWNAFQCDNLTIQVVENPVVNRASRNAKTAQDWAYLISEVLTSPLYGHYGQFSLYAIENGEDGGLLVSKVIVKTVCENQISALPVPPDYKNSIPFVTEDKFNEVISNLSNITSSAIDETTMSQMTKKIGVLEWDMYFLKTQVANSIGHSSGRTPVQYKVPDTIPLSVYYEYLAEGGARNGDDVINTI